MRYLTNVRDRGIILSPDHINEKMYQWDGGGMREAIVNRVGKYYYLSYDGAMPGKMSQSYWNACTARSEDLIHWEKRGVSLCASAITNSNTECKDFCSASSPWSIQEDGVWYRYYLGADHCSPEGSLHFNILRCLQLQIPSKDHGAKSVISRMLRVMSVFQ